MNLIDKKYFIGSGQIDPLLLCQKYGTPLYVYDTEVMEKQYNRLQSAFNVKRMCINFACKALNNINIMRFFKKLGSGLDTVSIQEVVLGLHAGFSPNNIIYTPNCVSLEEIEMAVKLGVRINIDNISILEQFGERYPDYPICIRINPHIMAGGNAKISVGHIDSKFGISFHQVPHILRIVENCGLKIEGVHMHTGSDILDVDVFLQGAEILFQVAAQFKDLDYIDFGSGFKVPYKIDDYDTDIEELGEKISQRFNQFCKEANKDITLMFEPGKFLVSQAGYFFARTNVVKQTTSTVFVGLDTGLNHFIRPMFYDAFHQIVNVTNPVDRQRLYTVVGYICETDTFANNRRITEIIEGDIVCFYNAGAYCATMASNYNSRFRPAEVMIYEGKDYLIKERESFDDLLRNQVDVEILKDGSNDFNLADQFFGENKFDVLQNLR